MTLRILTRAPRLCTRRYATSSASTLPASPLLHKIRKDLKAAMQAKDSNRLSVLRSILTQVLNASKTDAPINTDLQMLAILRKTANASRVASLEFKTAGRQDLAEKEDSQLTIMEEYAGCVETVAEADIEAAVKDVVEKMKANEIALQMGEVLKKVLAPNVLGGKQVERGVVAKVVKQILAAL